MDLSILILLLLLLLLLLGRLRREYRLSTTAHPKGRKRYSGDPASGPRSSTEGRGHPCAPAPSGPGPVG
uniref:Uncharacterized protein n=1 Tax=Mus musculus TaxID=10090 RepID=Q3V2J3_MOUSE|nr:unnamed protein product [Mus musculus]BAE20804.1 unnamed protein product [Mus musculus]